MDIRGLELKTLHHMHKPCNTAHLETADEPSMLLKTCISGERFNNYIRGGSCHTDSADATSTFP